MKTIDKPNSKELIHVCTRILNKIGNLVPAIIFKSKDERDLLKRVTKRLLDNKELNKDIIFQIIELWASLFKAEKI